MDKTFFTYCNKQDEQQTLLPCAVLFIVLVFMDPDFSSGSDPDPGQSPSRNKIMLKEFVQFGIDKKNPISKKQTVISLKKCYVKTFSF